MHAAYPFAEFSLLSRTCTEIDCRFGATCNMINSVAVCLCPSSCPTNMTSRPVCGSDNQTYASQCELRLFACRMHRDLEVLHDGVCYSQGVLCILTCCEFFRRHIYVMHSVLFGLCWLLLPANY